MEFTTQKELLEYLGKNGDDRHLVHRMIARGEVYKENGMYYYTPRVSAKDLRYQITELKEKIEELEKSGLKPGAVSPSDDVARLKKLLAEERSNTDYQIEEYNKLRTKCQNGFKKCYLFLVNKKLIDPKKQTLTDFYKRAVDED